ncbi:hypothetical protein C0Q70_01193 [Pomacea canaliculata]|uniref:U3 small nucleolar RNA-associated protein 6 N-terminal domain-containing protein n=1 Tax=Pomacea canaliculata TaxID=400727 RepID=A0A2T7PYV3_POMCA|nr:hypothetical protein C0Q70_01193 [Pomacea canaliculata]
MAEFVSKSIEDMLPEMERLERVRLFSKEEIRTILKKRQRLEYRLRKKTRQQMDYIRYIQYERSVLALIKKRRKLVGYNFKKERIEVPIIQRIHKLFQLCQTRFPFYKMELTATDMLKKGSVITDQTTVNDPALDGKIAEIILRNAVREFPGDIQILTDLMEACKNFEFARSHLDFLITELKEKFHAEPAMWNTLARHLLPTKFGESCFASSDSGGGGALLHHLPSRIGLCRDYVSCTGGADNLGPYQVMPRAVQTWGLSVADESCWIACSDRCLFKKLCSWDWD